MRERARLPAQRITHIQVLDQILYILNRARETLMARYGITTVNPKDVLVEAYVQIEESPLAHATKYRYKQFLRELAKALGLGNIARRKEAYRREMKKYIARSERMSMRDLRTVPDPVVEEIEEAQPSGELIVPHDYPVGDYENFSQYFDWEE